jgi:hypothetical protein
MKRKSKACAPQASASVIGFAAHITPMIVAQASFILPAISFFRLQQATHQRKEQP